TADTTALTASAAGVVSTAAAGGASGSRLQPAMAKAERARANRMRLRFIGGSRGGVGGKGSALAAQDAAQHAAQHLAAQAPSLVACDLLHHAIALAAARAGRAEQEFAEDAADAAALVAVLGGGLGVRRLRLLGLRLGLIRQHL